MKVLLDTHALLLWLTDDERLPAPVSDLIDDHRDVPGPRGVVRAP